MNRSIFFGLGLRRKNNSDGREGIPNCNNPELHTSTSV